MQKCIIKPQIAALGGKADETLDGGGNRSHWHEVPRSPRHPAPSTPKTALPLLASEISGALRRDRPDRVSPTLSGQVLTAGLVNVRSAVK